MSRVSPPKACKWCPSLIVFALHYQTRSKMPFDATATAIGSWRLDIDGAGERIATPLARPLGAPRPGEQRYIPHWATCAHAREARR